MSDKTYEMQLLESIVTVLLVWIVWGHRIYFFSLNGEENMNNAWERVLVSELAGPGFDQIVGQNCLERMVCVVNE